MKKLVYSSVGDENSTSSWLCPGRSYDVCIAHYGDGSFEHRDAVEYYVQRKGYKFPNFLECVKRYPDLLDYDYYLFMDDDIIAQQDTVEQIFSMTQQYRLEISHPSYEAEGSEYSWPHLLHREHVILEYTNFVEIGCFCVTRNLLNLIMPCLKFIQTGHGLDLVIWDLLGKPKNQMGILHSLQISHPPRKDGLRLHQRFSDWRTMCEKVERELAKHVGKDDPHLRDHFKVMSFGCIKNGVSVVLCCHNSAPRITQALEFLSRQTPAEKIPWEVIVVDNASSDRTASIAETFWAKARPDISFRVVREPKLGILHARRKGLEEAAYEFVSFVDDDNWVDSHWVGQVYETMSQNPQIGALGGLNEPVFETEPPKWFDTYLKAYAAKHTNSYALGPQGPSAGDVTESRGYLWGAGLTLRKTAWQSLLKSGFEPFCVGVQGFRNAQGEDSEICLALCLDGWRLWYDPRLKLKHFLTSKRLSWEYLRKAKRTGGVAALYLNLYRWRLREAKESIAVSRPNWKKEALVIFKILRKNWKKSPFFFIRTVPGDPEVLRWEKNFGQFLELLKIRNGLGEKAERVLKFHQACLTGRMFPTNEPNCGRLSTIGRDVEFII